MHLSLASWSFRSLTLEENADLAKLIGIGALDVSTKRKPGHSKAQILSDPQAAAERVKALGIPVANYFHHFGEDHYDRNLALPGIIDDHARELERALTFADAAGIPTLFFVPGMINPGQSRRQAFEVCVDSLKALLDVQKDFKAEICIEPITHSITETPDIVRELVDETGIRLALDYSHFVCLGFTQDQIDPLCAHAAHVHLRQARAGELQTRFGLGTINFPAMFANLRDAGYSGALAIEYIHSEFMNSNSVDVMTETVTMRDCFNNWMNNA